MLRRLDIKNFAIIQKTSIDFSAGLNIITGETGAGKSIIIGALNLLLGGKAFMHQIKSGEKEASLSAHFWIENCSVELLEKLKNVGIHFTDKKELIIQRVFDTQTKTKSMINGIPVRIQFIKSISNLLVEIHGQHEHQNLLNTEYHRRVVDRFAAIQTEVQDFFEIFQKMQKLYIRLKTTAINEKERNRLISLFEHEIAEIKEASLEDRDEFDVLLEEEKQFKYQEKISKNLHEISNKLSNSEHSLLKELYDVDQLFEKTLSYQADLNTVLEMYRTAYFSLEEVASEIQNRVARFYIDPERIQVVRERLDSLQILFRKYGSNISEVLTYLENIELQYHELLNKGDEDKDLEKTVANLLATVKKKSIILSKKRYVAITDLESRINAELESLHMKNMKIKISISWNKSSDGLYEHHKTGVRYKIYDAGLDKIEFYLQSSISQNPIALGKIVSGGEMSRIMLALKKVILDSENTGTMIFDEIDTGVGGQVADAIGRKLSELSDRTQIICITHLHQIASFSSRNMSHFCVSKDSNQNTSIYKLSQKQRVEEIARMISGDQVTQKEIEYANSILKDKVLLNH